MKKHVITISREYGSGGHEVGRLIAEDMGIPFYDRAYFEAALMSGYEENVLRSREEKRNGSFAYNLAAALGVTGAIDEKYYRKQAELILRLYEEGSCVIVGRCADFILRGKPDVTSIFLYADDEFRIRKAIEEYVSSPEKALGWISISDRKRQNYYNNHTGSKWGAAENYHLSIDTGNIEPDNLVKLIENYVELKG